MALNYSQSQGISDRTGTVRMKAGKALHDLDEKELSQCVRKFNRRLTKRFSTCHIDLPKETLNDKGQQQMCKEHSAYTQRCIRGGVRLNFMFQESIKVKNTIIVDGEEEFVTDFKFSKKSVLVLPLCSNHTVTDMIQKLEDKFRILNRKDDTGRKLRIFERELSVTLQDVFFRELAAEERPLELFFLWKINTERKSMVVTDHNPNDTRYERMDLEELEKRLNAINEEESTKIQKVHESYHNSEKVIKQLMEDQTLGGPSVISQPVAEEDDDIDTIAGFDLELHEDHFNENIEEGTLTRPLSIEEKFRSGSSKLSAGPDTLKRCSFRLQIDDKSIYDLSQEEAIELIKSYEADPELKRSKIRLTVIPSALIPQSSNKKEGI